MNTIVKKTEIVKPIKSDSKEPIKQMKVMIDIETKKRQMLTEYISNHLKDGVDYGRIHISRHCPNQYDCKNDKHFTKPSLFKPGSEKFNSLFHLIPRFKKDTDTWEMLGSRAGVICYICELIDPKGNVVGEGRGVCTLDQRPDANAAVKIAEKRSQIDAVLRNGGLSDFFTQDLEDMSQDELAGKSQDKTPQKSQPAAPVSKKNEISQDKTKKINEIWLLAQKKGKEIAEITKAYKVESLYHLNIEKLNKIETRLVGMPDKKPVAKDQELPPIENAQDIDPDEVDRGIEQMKENKKKQ